MPDFKPTQEQLDIYDIVVNSKDNILIEALAGTGKTYTLVEVCKLLPKNDIDVTFLAFNKVIADTLKAKLPDNVRCQTTYSAGLGALKRKYKDIVFDEFKADKIIKEKSKNWKLGDEFKGNESKVEKYIRDIRKMVDLCRLTLTLDPKYIPYLCDKYDIKHKESKDLKRIMSVLEILMNDKSSYDFVDMVFISATDPKVWFFPQDYVLLDEAQDISKCQQRIIEKIIKKDRKTGTITGRLILCGDKHQCQPEGTMVLLNDKTYKKIEDLKIGDKVISYDTQKGSFSGASFIDLWGNLNQNTSNTILEINKRDYDDDLIVVESGDKISKYTPNHRCLIRFREDKTNYHFLYLMEKNGYFRIGIVPLWAKNKMTFGCHRGIQENADNFWIINVYENKFDAYLDEQYYSLLYQLPQMIFLHRHQRGNIDQKIIDNFYGRLDKEHLRNNAIKFLLLFKRKIEYPFWSKNNRNYYSKTHMCEIRACNIIKDVMQVIHFNDTNISYRTHGENGRKFIIYKPLFFNIDDLRHEHYSGQVYSLKIEKHEKYVADGILTHNSIYSFLGSDANSWEWFENYPNMKKLPLSTTFRCSKAVVEEARKLVPTLNYGQDADEGIVREGDVVEEANEGDFILCRTNAPLVRLFFHFLLKGKKASINGGDMKNTLLEMIGNNKDINELYQYWNLELLNYKAELIKSGVLNYETYMPYVALNDKIGTLEFICKLSKNIEDLKNKINLIFNDEVNAIHLLTVHASKGLEADRVFIIHPELLPMKTGNAVQYKQELNLKYISITRSRHELIYDRDFEKDYKD